MSSANLYNHDEPSKDVLVVLSKVTSHEVDAGSTLDHLGEDLVVPFWQEILENLAISQGVTFKSKKISKKLKISEFTKYTAYSFWESVKDLLE